MSDRTQCSQQDLCLRRISDARLAVDDLDRSLDRSSAAAAAEPVYLTFRPSCLHKNLPLHCGTSQCRLSRRGAPLAAPRRSIARRPDRTQKPGSDQSLGTVACRLLSPTSQKGNVCPPTNRNARSCDGPNTVCATSIDSLAARRRSLQTACKQCLRSSKQHRTFLDVSVFGRGRT